MSERAVSKTEDLPEDALVVGETAGGWLVWSGSRPPVRVAVVGGAGLALDAPAEALAARPWAVAEDIDVALVRDPGGGATLAAWAEALARASLLVLLEPLPARARHVLKLAAVAAVPAVALVAGDDDAERRLRGLIAQWGLDGDGAAVVRPAPGFDDDDLERLAAPLSALVAAARPRALPTGPLTDALSLEGAPPAARDGGGPPGARPTARARATLFTGRCVVGARQGDAHGPVRLAARCLPPPAKRVAWLDEENDVVAVRRVRR